VTIEILDKAEDDLVSGFAFYEARQRGLGRYFRDCLFFDIEMLRIHGGAHRIVYKNYHRALSKRFPFAIFYTLSGETIFIHAVVDCRRRPAWIKARLG
jgi:hypothetical protein